MSLNTAAALHTRTSLLKSMELSECCGAALYLKLENTQPSGSFKIRGVGHLVQHTALKESVKGLVSSSGGNAGMAAAYAGYKMALPTTVVIPKSTPTFMINKLEKLGAKVMVHGAIWNEANEKAVELASQDGMLLVHPYDQPLLWDGHSTIVDELVDDMGSIGSVVLSVGGGGLLCGVLQGLIRKGLSATPVLAMETVGADCFNVALKAGKPVSIGDITSLAKTLGALTVTERVFELLPQCNVISRVVTDREAVHACDQFADDHRQLVEPSCGAALAAVYSGIVKELLNEGVLKEPIVVVVCGGNAVTVNMIQQWKIQTGLLNQ